ncbi:MAG: hypothetical protein Tp138OMZ00d2C19078221_25 [Prokaryotic dsDNA virus sp.]|jgi:hypothetical protein|nr:MAG: hypothetical protein Tp138OMZ00d2C19078221_25 [Prokaryotic dsDNA virus sp.]
MNSQELAALTEKFQRNGGKVKQCATGDNAVRYIPRNLMHCQCGCNGDYTDHSMRAGESGRCASVIIL